MKHINLTNWRGSITDWTKLNYIYGGLDDSYATKGNLRIDKDNYNYVEYRESKNQAYERVKTIDYGANHVRVRIGTYPAGTYYIKVSGGIAFLYVGNVQTLNSIQNGGTFTLTAESILYIDWYSYNNDFTIMLNNGSTALPYEPYFEGKKYVITENFGIVDLGSLNWSGANGFFQVLFATAKQPATSTTIATWLLCSLYEPDTAAHIFANVNDKRIGLNPDNSFLQVRDNSYTTNSEFKTAMDGVMLTYELATPVIEVVE